MMRNADVDNPTPVLVPDEQLPDDQCFAQGKIRVLFERVRDRRKARWDPALVSRPEQKRKVACFTSDVDLDDQLGLLEADCLGQYVTPDITAYIVRYAHKTYACEVVRGTETVDQFYRQSGKALVEHLWREYPVPSTHRTPRKKSHAGPLGTEVPA